jgi:hypothetical protein
MYRSKRFSKICKIFENIYQEITYNENKNKIIKFLLYDTDCDNSDLMNLKDMYDEKIWNILCTYIKINIKPNYTIDHEKLTKNKIYRLIQI